MALEPVKMWEIVERAVGHRWSVPEFQRGFVWKTTQVRDLAESLWLDYPVGSLLLWNSETAQEVRAALDGQTPSIWLVDGQQRTTALCLLFGRKPYWWGSQDDWNRMLRKYDIRFDVAATEPPYFLIANAAIRNARGDRYIPLYKLLNLDTGKDEDRQKLEQTAEQVKYQGLCDGKSAMQVYTHLDRVRKIREKDMVTITIHHELEDVVEIFGRLNSRGTRVTEADIYLGVVASKNPGWVRDHFLPYLKTLRDFGFELDPNLLFRSLTAIGTGRVRFREIEDAFWASDRISPAWQRCKDSWAGLVHRLREHGILSDDPLPTKAALVTLTAIQDRFGQEDAFDRAFYWFLQASRFSRYSGSGTTSLDEDLRDVKEADNLQDAVLRLCRRFPTDQLLTADDFLRDYSDTRIGRFLLYLLVYQRHALDWDSSGYRIGFEGSEVLAGFRPQWHHIFPQKFLERRVDDAQIQALANIAVIGPKINIRIRAQDPMDYLARYNITPAKLEQQMIDPTSDFSVANYPQWLQARAERLAEEGNAYLEQLRCGA
jgi:hypothetical protein